MTMQRCRLHLLQLLQLLVDLRVELGKPLI